MVLTGEQWIFFAMAVTTHPNEWDQTLSDPNLQFCGLSQHLVNMENVVQGMSVVMELSWKTWNSDLIMFESSKVT